MAGGRLGLRGTPEQVGEWPWSVYELHAGGGCGRVRARWGFQGPGQARRGGWPSREPRALRPLPPPPPSLPFLLRGSRWVPVGLCVGWQAAASLTTLPPSGPAYGFLWPSPPGSLNRLWTAGPLGILWQVAASQGCNCVCWAGAEGCAPSPGTAPQGCGARPGPASCPDTPAGESGATQRGPPSPPRLMLPG